MTRHIVWDWNGTLLDDFHLVVEAVNVSLAAFGLARIEPEVYRQHYTRPVKMFYDRLLGRELSSEEWRRLDSAYLEVYFHLSAQAGLAGDAHTALEAVAAARGSQSLLSMAPHVRLVPWVEDLGVAAHFTRIQGTTGPSDGSKVPELASHLAHLEVEATEVVVIGDTPDDAAAAHAAGAEVILYDGGSHHRHDLEAVGVPLAHTLVEAVSLALAPGPTSAGDDLPSG